jgi:choline dehydrogenase-like flavoprotein
VFACACCVAITLPSAWASSSVGATGAQFDAVEEELSTTYDYIVVGAGVAGGVVAARLSQESPASVLVLETGTDESENPLLQPSYFFKDSKFTHLYRHFFSQEGENMNNRRLYHMNSKALGGGSAINAMVWTRGDPRDWDLWSEKTGIPGWTFGDVLPYYQTMETYERAVDGDLRGRDGPIHVAYYDPNPITLQAVRWRAGSDCSSANVTVCACLQPPVINTYCSGTPAGQYGCKYLQAAGCGRFEQLCARGCRHSAA